MKKCLLPLLLISLHSLAQSDTSYVYLNRYGLETNKEAAVYQSKIYESKGLWKKVDYWLNTDSVYQEATYLDREQKMRQGVSKTYYKSGTLKDSANYENGRRTTAWYFYEGGKKQSFADFDHMGKVTKQMGWDEAGNELKDFVVEKEARFPGGMEGWRRYLEKNLNANVAAEDKAPVGQYTVKVQFIVDKDGKVSNVKAVIVPPQCPSCGKEAEKVIRKGPNWEPAAQNGRAVIYQALQYLTFQVSAN